MPLSSILLHYFVRDLSLATFPLLLLFRGFPVSIWLLSRQSCFEHFSHFLCLTTTAVSGSLAVSCQIHNSPVMIQRKTTEPSTSLRARQVHSLNGRVIVMTLVLSHDLSHHSLQFWKLTLCPPQNWVRVSQ